LLPFTLTVKYYDNAVKTNSEQVFSNSYQRFKQSNLFLNL